MECRYYLVVALPGKWPLPEDRYDSCCPGVDRAGVRLCIAWRRGCPRPEYCNVRVLGGARQVVDERGVLRINVSGRPVLKAILSGYVALHTDEGIVVAIDEDSPYIVNVEVFSGFRDPRPPSITLMLRYHPGHGPPGIRRGWMY